jgi:acyl dehydratase
VAKQQSSTENLYYEDVVVGAEITTGTHTVSMKDILTFADVTRDHHPLHTDEDYCRNTQFGKPIAHGLYGLSLIEGLKSELKLYENTSVASLGWDKIRFKAPIFPGDSVRVKMRFIEKRESRKTDRGVVVEAITLVNQRDEVVTEAEHATLLIRRNAAR